MAEIIIEKGDNAVPVDDQLKAVVFGTQPKLVKQMADQLTRKRLLVRSVIDEKVLIKNMTALDPDLVFLELNGPTKSPIEDIVKIVFMWINNHARKVNRALNSPSARLWQKAKVIMYKSDIEGENPNPLGAAPHDLDEVLYKCQQIGNINYIGLYSPWSFIGKIKPFLTRNEQD